MRFVLPDWIALAFFFAMVLAVTLYGLVLSARFPAEHRRPSLRHGSGAVVLWGTVVVVAVAALLAARFGLTALPGYAAVLSGGLAILAAPLALKPLPDSFIDGRGGLIALAAVAAGLAILASLT